MEGFETWPFVVRCAKGASALGLPGQGPFNSERDPMFRSCSCPGPLVPWLVLGDEDRNFGSRYYLSTKCSPLHMLCLHDLLFCSTVFEK